MGIGRLAVELNECNLARKAVTEVDKVVVEVVEVVVGIEVVVVEVVVVEVGRVIVCDCCCACILAMLPILPFFLSLFRVSFSISSWVCP